MAERGSRDRWIPQAKCRDCGDKHMKRLIVLICISTFLKKKKNPILPLYPMPAILGVPGRKAAGMVG